MTQQQAQAIEQALERARKQGIRILGEGHMKATHQRFFLVSSADYCQSNRVYVVRVLSTELHCNCRASGICKHRAVVHQALKDERLAEQEREAERLASLPRELANAKTSEAEKLAQAERVADKAGRAILASHVPETFSIFK